MNSLLLRLYDLHRYSLSITGDLARFFIYRLNGDGCIAGVSTFDFNPLNSLTSLDDAGLGERFAVLLQGETLIDRNASLRH